MYLVKTDEFLSLFFVLRLGSEDKPNWPGGLCQKCRLGIFDFEVLWFDLKFEIISEVGCEDGESMIVVQHVL
jgi:hypothetical protein